MRNHYSRKNPKLTYFPHQSSLSLQHTIVLKMFNTPLLKRSFVLARVITYTYYNHLAHPQAGFSSVQLHLITIT